MYDYTRQSNILMHHGIKNQKWGLRRFQNPDGSLTPAGRERYRKNSEDSRSVIKNIKDKASKLGTNAKAYIKLRSEKRKASKTEKAARAEEKKANAALAKAAKKEAKKQKAEEKRKLDRSKWLNSKADIDAHWKEMTNEERDEALKVLEKFDKYETYRDNSHKRLSSDLTRINSVLTGLGTAAEGVAKTAKAYYDVRDLLDKRNKTSDSTDGSNGNSTNTSNNSNNSGGSKNKTGNSDSSSGSDLSALRDAFTKSYTSSAINSILSAPAAEKEAAIRDAKRYMKQHEDFFNNIAKKAAKKKGN